MGWYHLLPLTAVLLVMYNFRATVLRHLSFCCMWICASSHFCCQSSFLTLHALLDMIMQQLHQCWQYTVSVALRTAQLVLAQHYGLVSVHLRGTVEQENGAVHRELIFAPVSLHICNIYLNPFPLPTFVLISLGEVSLSGCPKSLKRILCHFAAYT